MIDNSRPDGGFVLHYGGLTIPFRVDYRRRKHLAITVHPELRLEVSAPEGGGAGSGAGEGGQAGRLDCPAVALSSSSTSRRSPAGATSVAKRTCTLAGNIG